MWLAPGAWLAPEVVTPKQGSTPAAWGSGNPCPLGAVGREWGPQVRPPTHKRFSHICRSCCRLLHPRLREASGQQGQWTAVQKPCRAVRCWRGKEPGSERGAALAAPHPAPLVLHYLAAGSSSGPQKQLEHRQTPPRMASREALQPR